MTTEIDIASKGFANAQAIMADRPVDNTRTKFRLDCGWYDTSVDSNVGSFAVVQDGAGLDELVGEYLRVHHHRAYVNVYVVALASIPNKIALSRRAWLAISDLAIVNFYVQTETLK